VVEVLAQKMFLRLLLVVPNGVVEVALMVEQLVLMRAVQFLLVVEAAVAAIVVRVAPLAEIVELIPNEAVVLPEHLE
jgi:hypothetical protein